MGVGDVVSLEVYSQRFMVPRMTTKVPRKLHYMRARVMKHASTTLQALVASAYSHLGKAEDRVQRFEGISTVRNLVGREAQLGMEFGMLVTYEPGASRLLIAQDPEATDYSLEQLSPLSLGGRRKRDFLDSVVYFGICDNHLLLLQAEAHGSRHLENYFNWMINAARLAGEIALVAPVARNISAIAKKVGVKEVRFGSGLLSFNEVEAKAGERASGVHDIATREVILEETGLGMDLLRHFLPPERLESYNLASTIDSNLTLEVSIKYKRSTNAAGARLLYAIASATRHFDDADVSVELNNGSVLRRSDLTVVEKIRVEARDSVIVTSDLFPQMKNALDGMITNGMVDP